MVAKGTSEQANKEDFKERDKKPENKLNELSGKEWIKFTKSWFKHNPPQRDEEEKLHPAKFPESLVKKFIEFFTKRGQWVLDPFAGTGSAIVAAKEIERNAIGIELMQKYQKIAQKRIDKTTSETKITTHPDEYKDTTAKVYQGDSLKIYELWKEKDLPKFDYCITSPPYWNQLKRNNMRQKERKENGLDTKYGENERDIGNIDNYEKFLEEQKNIFDKVYKVIKDEGYLTIITNNVYADGRMYPLAFDTVSSLSDKWVPKDERIWLQDDKSLLPLGIYNAWVGNRHHQYCLIFRKEENKNE